MPQPPRLRRFEPGQPVFDGPAHTGAAPGGRLKQAIADFVTSAEAPKPDANDEDEKFHALIFDATGIANTAGLRELYDFFHPTIRQIATNGRVVVLATPPELSETPQQAIAQRAIEGFTRSVAKEIGGRGATAQLVYVAPGAEQGVESTLRFLVSAKSAYVDGQVIRIGAAEAKPPADWDEPLAGKVAVVTGASRGIGKAIAETLARDGAHVICADIPAAGEALVDVANEIDGETLQLDVTADDAPQTLVDHVRERHNGIDIVIHNAGITKDKTLGRMDEDRWDAVLAVNLTSQERMNDALIESDVLRPGGRIVTVSSVSGIAGNRGQTNYGTTKAGVIGTVDAYAPLLAERQATINAVAPGFIETQMTAAMPLVVREGGRRMNSLAQGGLPVDVAETIAWFASPGSEGVNGNLVRVCGQAMIGA